MTASIPAVRRRAKTPSRFAPHLLLGLLAVYFLVPLWWMVINSSKSAAGLFGGTGSLWFAKDIDYLGNLQDLFTYDGGIYLHWLGNSALYAIEIGRAHV